MTIRTLKVRNLKRFVSQDFQLAPLTVLTGLNSSGKSSAVQAILLAYHAQLVADGGVVPLNVEPGLGLGQPVDVLAAEALTTDVGVALGVDDAEFSWTFETQFDGADTAAHVLCSAHENAGLTLSYLGAERMGPRTSQPVAPVSDADPDFVFLGDDGRFVAHALAVHGRRQVASDLQHPDRAGGGTVSTQTEAWMSDLVGAVQFEADLVPRTDLATLHVRSTSSDDWYLPTNVGFGISYALPIVVAGLTAKPGTVLIVDSPEAHLHPAAQSGIGRFLARVAASGTQVILESHSDHVVNGIRRAVVEQLITAVDVVVHFLAARAEPVRIDLDARGRLSEWPAGFFDQIEADLKQITRPRV